MDQVVFNFSKRDSQTELILSHLRSGKSINPLQSLRLYGCFRLGARVWDLKKQGFNISSKMVDVGEGKKVAEYRLENEAKNIPYHVEGELAAPEAGVG